VPATPFFEWTGPKGKKVKWRIVRRDGAPFTFAGIWDRAHTADGTVESFTLLTCAPGPDIAPLHDRQPVIVEPADWKAWLDPANPADRIVRAAPAGTLVYGPAEAPRAA
jgi:putative SOS response-associated peptidase YedK